MSSQNNKNNNSNKSMRECVGSNLVFHGLDAIVGILIVISSIIVLSRASTFYGFFVPVYMIVFGFLVFLFVIYVPPRLFAALIFYFNFCGRGLSFLFLGCVSITFGDDFSQATGIITIIISFLYLLLSILTKWCRVGCSLPPPFIQYQEGWDSVKPSNSAKTNNSQTANNNNNGYGPTPTPTTPSNDNKNNHSQQTAPSNTNTNNNGSPQQQPTAVYGSAYNDTPNTQPVEQEQKPPQYAAIAVNNTGPSLLNDNDDRNALNKLIMDSFGKEIKFIELQQVPGYNGAIPKVLVMLEQRLNDTGGYKKYGIFDPETISSKKNNDESYLMANNIISFFSSLPEPLLTDISSKVLGTGVSKDSMWRVIEKMPDPQSSITQFVWDMLAKVAMQNSNTQMDSEQLARIFGPLCTMVTQKDIKGNTVSSNALQASKNIVCFRRGIDWRMEKL